MSGRVRFALQNSTTGDFELRDFEIVDGGWVQYSVNDGMTKIEPSEADEAFLAQIRVTAQPKLDEIWRADATRHMDWRPTFAPWGNFVDLIVHLPVWARFTWDDFEDMSSPEAFDWVPDERVVVVYAWWKQPRGLATMGSSS